MILPTRGFCHATFLLSHSARFHERYSVHDWVTAAREIPTVMAGALALQVIADQLITLGLAKTENGMICIADKIIKCGDEADTDTFAGIAKCVLEACPPPWLSGAVFGGRFRPELIPAEALEALGWLGDLLEPILVSLSLRNDASDLLRTKLGMMGELAIIAFERSLNRVTRHVSKISDAFGYDIESVSEHQLLRIEVKACLPDTQGRIFLTRNEASVASRFPTEWLLRQVVIRPDALMADVVRASDVISIREMSAIKVLSFLPPDDGIFRWLGDAELKFPPEAWTPVDFALDKNWIKSTS